MGQGSTRGPTDARVSIMRQDDGKATTVRQ